MQPVTLRTPRLVLSHPLDSDVDALYEACQDPEIQRYTTVPSPYERRHAEEFVERVAKHWADGTEQSWVMRDGESVAGMIGLYRQGACATRARPSSRALQRRRPGGTSRSSPRRTRRPA